MTEIWREEEEWCEDCESWYIDDGNIGHECDPEDEEE